MTVDIIKLRLTTALAGLLACAVIGSPCAAQEQGETAGPTDTSAYQLLQLLNQNEALSSEISRLRGQIEELLEYTEQSRESQQRIATDFDQRISKIEVRPQTDSSQDKTRITELESRLNQLEQTLASMHEVVAAVSSEPVRKSPQETIYEGALEKYRSGDLAAAERDFRAFLQLYADDVAAPNAAYWLAEAQLRQGQFQNAIDNGTSLLTNYPISEKAADTMFLLGKAHLELGDLEGARSAWQELVAMYPESPSASKAAELLDRLP